MLRWLAQNIVVVESQIVATEGVVLVPYLDYARLCHNVYIHNLSFQEVNCSQIALLLGLKINWSMKWYRENLCYNTEKYIQGVAFRSFKHSPENVPSNPF